MKAHLELEGLKLKLQDNGLSVKLDRIQERIDNLVALREHAIKCGGSLYEAARCQSDIEVLLWVQRVFACV
jgi:hypothetical protein